MLLDLQDYINNQSPTGGKKKKKRRRRRRKKGKRLVVEEEEMKQEEEPLPRVDSIYNKRVFLKQHDSNSEVKKHDRISGKRGAISALDRYFTPEWLDQEKRLLKQMGWNSDESDDSEIDPDEKDRLQEVLQSSKPARDDFRRKT